MSVIGSMLTGFGAALLLAWLLCATKCVDAEMEEEEALPGYHLREGVDALAGEVRR